jgi:hypothetical protein
MYDYRLWAIKYSTYGKFRWWIDGEDTGVGNTIDLYSATTVYNHIQGERIQFTTPGIHTFLLKNVGKNPASSGYYLAINGMYIALAPE